MLRSAIHTAKGFVNKHINALRDETTADNEKQAIAKNVKSFLLSLCQTVIIIGICYMILAPLIGIFSASLFSDRDAYNPMVYLIPQEFTLERYEKAIEILDYVPTVIKSLLFSFSLLLLQILICSMTGYGFARFNFPFKKLLFGCVVATIMIPVHTIMLPLYLTFKEFDPLGICTALFGDSVSLMGSPAPIYIMTALGCGLRSGLYIYIFNQFFRGMPKEIEEAAFVDGAGTWYTYFFIMLRNAMPSCITVAVFSMVWQYNDTFYSVLFMVDEGMAIGVQLQSIIPMISQQYRIPDKVLQQLYLDAGIILMLVPIVLVYVVLQKHFVEGVERSGIVG